MTRYEKLMSQSDECCRKAIEYAKKQDWNMAIFYKNVSNDFKTRARNLKILVNDEAYL